ncbi:hypothetical protein SCLCIDRAFT_134734 [Scleroderma citrinum Foug A]|uniref:Uncharacterized protein n=1 Tax=Scleroderma citrinum Foug A TaxID=1036808 RepID=A0A0C2Z0V0_9AGAM|nr:hypothetical protein SCLCIDRAFT_134734 [Scleroderma citrinum Foug A]
MPKHSKSGGPPYTDPPSASYVVVVKPWSVEPSPGRRKSEDYNRIATWVTYVLWEAANRDGSIPTVECVYRMRTRDEVIVQLPLGTNTSPLLGQHNWASFVDEWNDPPGAQKATLVFQYNWTNNGDPANHNWEEFFPDILPLNSVPIKSPYPLPLWVKVPVTLTSLVLSIPKPPTPPPQPEPQCPLVPLKTETKQIGLEMPDEKPADLSPAFRPYSPPSHYPLPARFQNKSTESKTSEKPRLFRKSDPYEVGRFEF